MWRSCCFRTEKAESSTVRLVPGGSCDGLQAVLVRDDALDLTLSRPSSGFGTFQLEAVMFRNPNWFVYRKPLRSSFCTCVSLSMSCDVVCFFCPSTLRTATNCLDHQKASLVTGGPKATFGSPVTKDVFGQGEFSSQPRSPYFAAVCLSQSRKDGRWLQSSVHGGEMR